jgi:hypothetical protein
MGLQQAIGTCVSLRNLERFSTGNWFVFLSGTWRGFQQAIGLCFSKELEWRLSAGYWFFSFSQRNLNKVFTDMAFRCFSKDLERLSSDDWLCFPI